MRAEKFAVVSFERYSQTSSLASAVSGLQSPTNVFEMNLKYFTHMRPMPYMAVYQTHSHFNFEAREVRQITSIKA